jgi:hypothetical protein
VLVEYQTLTRGRKKKENGVVHQFRWQFATIPHNLNHKFVLTLHAITRMSFLISYCLILEFSRRQGIYTRSLTVLSIASHPLSCFTRSRQIIRGRSMRLLRPYMDSQNCRRNATFFLTTPSIDIWTNWKNPVQKISKTICQGLKETTCSGMADASIKG